MIYDYEPFFVICVYLFTMFTFYQVFSSEELFEKISKLFLAVEEKKKEEVETPEKVVVLYEDKYKEEYMKRKGMPKLQKITEEKEKSLKNSFVIEYTPLGNVIMFYDVERETFTFYSDHNIPYRYLEVVSRKYVLMNDCVLLYVDMEDEIKEAEKKVILEKEQKQKEEQQKEENDKKSITTKKSVFAKLKKYNRVDAKSQITQTDKNNKTIANQSRMTSSNDKVKEIEIVKERANRYSYEGKLVNFSFLKKVDKKVVDSKYAMSFADFKKKLTGKK